MENTKTIREILDWFARFNKYDVLIQTKSKEF